MLGKLHIHNPGNIRQSTDLFIGEIKPSSDTSFKEFANNSFGYRAMFKVLDSYRKRGIDSIEQIVTRYSEDNVSAYVDFVVQRTGFASNAHIPNTKQAMTRLVAAMSRFENGVDAKFDEVAQGWDMKENIETAAKVVGGAGVLVITWLFVLLILNSKR